jgi:hypothetical protein
MPALLYGLFACYAVSGKCDLRIDSKAHDVPVFSSLEDCERFGASSTGQSPDKEGKWAIDEGHYYQCVGLTPMSVAALAPPEPARPVYRTSAEALQRDFRTDPDALARKIGGASLEVTGTLAEGLIANGTALQLLGDSWDVTAWLTRDGMSGALGLKKHAHVTLSCDRIGTLLAATARRSGVVELHDCTPLKAGT